MVSSLGGGNAGLLDEPDSIRQALLQAEGNVMRTARLLGISRGALRYRMRQYGIDPAHCKGLGQLFSSISRATTASPTLLPVRAWKRLTSLVDSRGDSHASDGEPSPTGSRPLLGAEAAGGAGH